MEVGYFRGSPEDFLNGHFLNAPQKLCEGMDSPEFSLLSSMRGEFKSELYVQPHYKEAYRLAIDHLVEEGREAYHDVLKAERIGNILSDEEIFFITTNAEQLVPQTSTEEKNCPADKQSSSGTYWPVKSDAETPNLELGWPDFLDEKIPTKIDLLFHPPRPNNPTIKEVIRKHIQDARQVIAIVMDAFSDVDIFKEAVDASIHGVAVYVLLDHSHLKSFLSMAESLDVKVQQLRHMRVRTVKGQDYLCRSGAKFYGALEQKFLLVDCHIAIYGSYSYTWSFEKINQSMVQVIRGHLVKSYDEEFRILYAKSTVPAELTPPESWSVQNDLIGQPTLTKLIGRRDQLRHSLDTAYQRTNERKFLMRDLEDRPFEKENNIRNGITVHGHKPQFPYFDSEDSMNNNKRHSYAGERGDGYLSQHLKLRGSNWNVSRDGKNGQINHSMNNYLPVPQKYRGQSMQKVPFMQQNKSPSQNVSKSLMHTWRMETYLNNSDTPFAEPCEYLDQFGSLNKGGSFMQGRIRNSLALGSTLPEQMGLPRFTNTSRGVGPLATPKTHLHYSSMKWNPEEAEERVNSEDFMAKQQSQQIIDDFSPISGLGPGNNSYASLGRTQQILTSPEYLTDNWYKRHSVADPRSNTEPACESPDDLYGSFQRTSVSRSTAAINTQSKGYRSSLKEDQRSVSHYDVKSVTNTKSSNSQIWKEPLSRALSAAALGHNSKNSIDRPNNASSPEKKRAWKIKSLLNIPERKADPVHSMKTPSVTSGDSTDTLTAEEEERISCRGKNLHQTTSGSVKASGNHKDSGKEDNPKFSKPRFVTEENQSPSQSSFDKTTAAKKTSAPDRSLRLGSENRLYSRFEPFCSLEKKLPNSQGKSKSFSKADVEHSASRATKGHHENKLEKLFHRMGSLLHKNK